MTARPTAGAPREPPTHAARGIAGRLLVLAVFVLAGTCLLLAFGPDLGRARVAPGLASTTQGRARVLMVSEVFPNALPLGFPAGDSDPEPYSSQLSVLVDGISAGSPHRDHETVRTAGGGYSHWGDMVLVAMPDGHEGGEIVLTWPLVPRGWAAAVGIAAILLVRSHLARFARRAAESSRALSWILRRERPAAALALALAVLVCALGWFSAVLSRPSVPLFSPDSVTWLSAGEIVPPYYSFVFAGVDGLGRLFGLTRLEAIPLVNLTALFASAAFLASALCLRTAVPWTGAVFALLFTGADAITIYGYHVLTEAPACAAIMVTLAALILAHPGRQRWLVLAALSSAAGYALRPSLVFLLPLFLAGVILLRPGRRVLLRSLAAWLVGLGLVYLVPLLLHRNLSNQLGIVLYPRAYMLVRSGLTAPAPGSSAVDIALYRATEPVRSQRERLGPLRRLSFDQNSLGGVSSTAQQAAVAHGRAGLAAINEALTGASFAILRAHPREYVVEASQHAWGVMTTEAAGVWGQPWYGSPLRADYERSLPVARTVEELFGRSGIQEAVQGVSGGALTGVPPLLDLTPRLVTYPCRRFLWIASVISGFWLVLGGLLRRLGADGFAVGISAAAGLGYLTSTALITFVIPRYVVPADLLLLAFTAALASPLLGCAARSVRPLD